MTPMLSTKITAEREKNIEQPLLLSNLLPTESIMSANISYIKDIQFLGCRIKAPKSKKEVINKRKQPK